MSQSSSSIPSATLPISPDQCVVLPPDDLICVICSHIVHKPLALNCCHLCCGACLTKWWNGRSGHGYLACPTCKTPNPSGSGVLDVNQNAVWRTEQLVVKCVHSKLGCTYQGQLGMNGRVLQEHINKCSYSVKPCPNAERGCTFKGVEEEMKKHTH